MKFQPYSYGEEGVKGATFDLPFTKICIPTSIVFLSFGGNMPWLRLSGAIFSVSLPEIQL
jgi:hypothetical protein